MRLAGHGVTMLSQSYGTASNEFGTSQKNPYAVTPTKQPATDNSAGSIINGMSQPSATTNPYAVSKAQATSTGATPPTANTVASKTAASTTTTPQLAINQNAQGYYNNPINYQSYSGNPLFSIIASLGRYMAPLAGQQAQFAGQMESGREGALQNFINQFSPQSQQAQVATYGSQANENAGKAAQYAAAQGASQGISPAYTAGNTASEFNNAANATNQYQAQVNSPQYQQQVLQSVLGAYGQAQQNPTLQAILGMQPGIQNQEQINAQSASQGGMLGGLGGILGALGGGGGLSSILNMFGGGSGSSANTSPAANPSTQGFQGPLSPAQQNYQDWYNYGVW